MTWLNSRDGYGALTKVFHWAIVALFVYQYVVANIMLRLGAEDTFLGLSQGTYYNWHKSIGLVALAFASARLVARLTGDLPEWAPTLSEGERRFAHRTEQLLYAAMFAMPISGYVYVMAGGYGVNLFGVVDLTNPIGKVGPLAVAAKWFHIMASYVLLVVIAGHVGLVLRHHLVLKDGLLRRMLPASRRLRPARLSADADRNQG